MSLILIIFIFVRETPYSQTLLAILTERDDQGDNLRMQMLSSTDLKHG
jgi:hypothetical protein